MSKSYVEFRHAQAFTGFKYEELKEDWETVVTDYPLRNHLYRSYNDATDSDQIIVWHEEVLYCVVSNKSNKDLPHQVWVGHPWKQRISWAITSLRFSEWFVENVTPEIKMEELL